jgi:membrane fusion protein (multidrug efflux system)
MTPYISPEINGQIQTIAVDRGSRVRKGDLILKLNTDVTQKTMEEVETSLELAKRVFTKQEELWEQNIGSELQYLEAKNGMESLEARLATLQQQLEMARVTAPFGGIIDDIMVEEGELASPGIPAGAPGQPFRHAGVRQRVRILPQQRQPGRPGGAPFPCLS